MNFECSNKIKEFNVVSNEIDEMYHKMSTSIGLSDSAYEILNSLLVLGEGITQTDIYKSSCLNKQTVNSSVKQLEKNNMIVLKKKNSKEYNIFLTDKGKSFINDKIIPLEKIEEQVLEEMTEEEYNSLINLMKRYLSIYKDKIDNFMSDDK